MKSKQLNQFYFDGRLTSESEHSTGLYREIVTAIASEEGVHTFSSTDRFEAWMSQSPLSKRYQVSLKKREKALNRIEKAGGDEVRALLNSLSLKLKAVNSDLASLGQLLNKDDDFEELLSFAKIVLSPRIGTIRFYKEKNFARAFDEINGLFHLSSWYVGDDDNDSLSSFRAFGTGVTLFEHQGWEGRAFHIIAPVYGQDNPFLGWFDNMMSSYFFWA